MAQECLSDEVLDSYFDSGLDPLAREFVQRHITSCQRCSERIDRYLLGPIPEQGVKSSQINLHVFKPCARQNGKKICSDKILGLEAHQAQLSPLGEKPSIEKLFQWFLGERCEATDGCIVEHDGTCPHGHPSWLKYLSLI
mgnify:CR=1 FL=1